MDEQGREPVDELTLEPLAVVRKRGPRTLWAVLAVVGLAAGALVVTSSDGDGGQRPGLPVALVFGGSVAGRAEGAADAMLAWTTYVAGDDLPSLGGDGAAYRLSGDDVDEARVRTLAEAMYLDGELERTEGGWSVVDAERGHRLDVSSRGGAYWSYSSSEQGCATEDGSPSSCSSGCATDAGEVECEESGGDCVRKADRTTCTIEASGTPCGPGTDCIDPTTETTMAPCVTTDPAPDAPTCASGEPVPDVEPREAVTPPDDIAAFARDVVAAGGLPVDDAIVTGTHVSNADDEGPGTWFVTVEVRLDGLPSGLLSFLEIVGGQLRSGYGVLGTLEGLGGYPLLDTRAAIDRANAQMGRGETPGIAADSGSSSGAGTSDPGAGADGGSATDAGGATGEVEATTGGDDPLTTVADPCLPPEGASDGCGGTTGCGGDGCTTPPDTATTACKVQPDGTELCEAVDPCAVEQPQATTTLPCSPDCPQELATGDVAVGAPDVLDCAPPIDPVPVPEPEPVEIVLVDAERSLVPLPATDGSADVYLVPAYRFTADDGGQVDLPAVADEALAGPVSTDTTVPATDLPLPQPQPEPQPCEVLEEGDASGSTHTVQTCATPNEDPRRLGEGEEPAIGVGYDVDVDKACGGGSFLLGGQVWITDDDAPSTWGDDRHEGGTFTLDSPDHGTFVGDAAKTKVGTFRTLPPNEDVFCTPEPR